MPRHIHKLSTPTIKRLRTPGCYADGGGLYLRVTPSGSRGWIFRFGIAGRKRDAGLGRFPNVSLAKAREAAARCRSLVAEGIDPIVARHEAREAARAEAAEAMTFEACAKAYVAAHESGWRNEKHRQQWRNTLATYVYPVFGAKAVQDVGTEDVLAVLNPLWLNKPETASRTRGRIEAVLDWAKVSGHRDGENCARWRGHLEHLLPAKSKVRQIVHHAALPFSEIGDFMCALREETAISAKALEFAILTAARTGEALGARWNEIDLRANIWVIPVHRMKGGREHRVPLSAQAILILREMAEIQQGDYVFPGYKPGRPLSNMALLMLLRRMRYGHITAHGFRSTFRDWAAETRPYQNIVVEMALAHTVPDRVEAAYRRGDLLDKRRKLMADWCAYCERRTSNMVVPFRKLR